MPISQDQITTLDQLEEKLTLALTDLLLLRDSNNEDYKVKVSTILQAAVDKAGAELIGGNVESGNTKAVTGNEVANIMSSLPNDAVLHYSFDEIPDIPDGTADERYLNGNTYEVAFSGNKTITTDAYVEGDDLIHKSNVNGNLNFKSDISVTFARGAYKSLAVYSGKVVIFDIQTKTNNIQPRVEYKVTEGGSKSNLYPLGTSPLPIGKYRITLLVPDYYSYNLSFYAQNANDYSYTEWELLNFYSGDGSYVTPIIDNVNGENNGTNNGGIAVQGVSGKGAYFLNGKYTQNSNYALSPNFSLSLWAKPDNTTMSQMGILLQLGTSLYLVNGSSLGGEYDTLYLTLGYANNTYQTIYLNQLLTVDWSNVVVTKNDNTLKVYINGICVNTTSLTQALANATGFTCCSFNNTRPQTIDDLLIYDRALTEAEVMALYLNKANTPKYYNRADWKLEQIEAAAEE